jgi:hypothetical protein
MRNAGRARQRGGHGERVSCLTHKPHSSILLRAQNDFHHTTDSAILAAGAIRPMQNG